MMDEKEGQKRPADDRQWTEGEMEKISAKAPQATDGYFRAHGLAAIATDEECAKGVSYSGSTGAASGQIGSNRAVRTPTVGDMVLVDIGHDHNGTRVHPAIVTRVWSSHCINVTAWLDGGGSASLSSVVHKSQILPPVHYGQARPIYWFNKYDGPPLG